MSARLPLFAIAISAFFLASVPFTAVRAAEVSNDTRTILQMADYVAVDYRQAVQGGVIISDSEFAEMREFARTIGRLAQKLQAKSGKSELLAATSELVAAVDTQADEAVVKAAAKEVTRRLLSAYPIPIAPKGLPNFSHGAALYERDCAVCHGATGHGDGPDADSLDPRPIDFHDALRQRQRSLFGLYNTIATGVEGTAMAPFDQLSEAERWDLAFYISQFLASDAERDEGDDIWSREPNTHYWIPDLSALAQTAPAALADKYGPQAFAVIAYLRAHPNEVASRTGGPLQLTLERLQESVDAHKRGDLAASERLALSAYLDGFEVIEPSLTAVDPTLVSRTEQAMLGFRALVQAHGSDAQILVAARDIRALLAEAELALANDQLGASASFAASFIILFREGLEALLVVAAIYTFLSRAGRHDALSYVHAGWGTALVFGGITWVVSTYLVNVSGANRELTEGLTGLVAAAILLWVGYWLHGKSYADRWQKYVKGKLNAALEPGRLWILALVTFLAVYREILETILFYVALWQQGEHTVILAGATAAAASLGLLVWLLYRFGLQLPISAFFRWSSVLVAGLAVIFVGSGVAALQEAGLVPIDVVNFISLPILGFHNNVEVMFAQAAVLALVIVSFMYSAVTDRRVRRQAE